jgi:integrase
MLERYFAKPSTIDRIRANWLAPQIEQYVEWLDTNHYAPRNVHRRVPILCHFGDFARQRGETDVHIALSFVEDFASKWVEDRGLNCRTVQARNKALEDARNPVRQMLLLATKGVVSVNRQQKKIPFTGDVPGFLQYLREERGLRETSIRHYIHYLHRFADYLKRTGVASLSSLSPALLAAFVVDTAPGMAKTSRRNMCGALVDVPRSVTWDEVRMMFEAVDRRTVRGRRDYAILLLLVTYGLRAHEVARMTVDDIDWKRDRLQIPERKAGHWTAYPLASVVAEALIEYLQSGRPQTDDRHIFFQTLAPRAPIRSSAISSAVAIYLRKAGVQVHRAGSHTLRHTCVQRLIDAEFPFKTIGDYVGHRSPQSTEIYTKVAIATLRAVAMGDGEAL